MFPDQPRDEKSLEELLSRPTTPVAAALSDLGGDVLLLGAGGKIGPTMARMARRALDEAGSSAAVHAVSRFTDPVSRERLEAAGVRTISADLSAPENLVDLPEAAGVFYLAAMKFGTTGAESRTWWSNTALPAFVASRYRGVPTLAYSTGNVYPLTPLHHGGSLETDPTGPVGEYAQSCLGRERLFTDAALRWGTPTTVFRLNYACELRYGVLPDLAATILAGDPVDVTMPAVNLAWQGDTTAWALASIGLAGTPPTFLNATGPETVPVRRLAELLAHALGRELLTTGTESSDALLSDAGTCFAEVGYPTVPLRRLVGWVADWAMAGGAQFGRPTKFQQRAGSF